MRKIKIIRKIIKKFYEDRFQSMDFLPRYVMIKIVIFLDFFDKTIKSPVPLPLSESPP